MTQPPGTILPSVPVRFTWRGEMHVGVTNQYYPGGTVLAPGYYVIAHDERGRSPTYFVGAIDLERDNPNAPRWPADG